MSRSASTTRMRVFSLTTNRYADEVFCLVTQQMTVKYFQDMRRAGNKGERLGLTDLLAKPHQRIPRYRLLIQVSLSWTIMLLMCEKFLS